MMFYSRERRQRPRDVLIYGLDRQARPGTRTSAGEDPRVRAEPHGPVAARGIVPGPAAGAGDHRGGILGDGGGVWGREGWVRGWG